MGASTAWTNAYHTGQVITIPLKNGEGGFIADDATLDELEGEGRVVVRYEGSTRTGPPATSRGSATEPATSSA